MSEFVMLGVAGTFAVAMALFIGTAAAALPMLAYDKVRAQAKARARR